MSTRGRGRGNRSSGARSCFNCGKPGHVASQCRSTGKGKNQGGAQVVSFGADIPPFVDTHCHVEYLYDKYKTSSYNVIFSKIKAFAPSFEACISNFCDPASLSPSFGIWKDLLDNEPSIYGCFGIHPHSAKHYNDSVEERICECLKHEKALAWGECGLDYHYNHSPKDIQRIVFERQARKAVELGKPLVVHSRKASEDTLTIMKAALPTEWKIHIHCFTDDAIAAQNIIDHFPNAFFGFTGVVTFKTAADICDAMKRIIPLNRILLETDAPYMVPEGLKGKVSHPGMCLQTATFIAKEKGIEFEALLNTVRENTREMYSI